MTDTELRHRIPILRRFNRFYTRRIGVLRREFLQSPYSLAQARVIFELAQRKQTTAGELLGALGLDPGYLSRLMRGFEKEELIIRERSAADGRQWLLRLTPAGEAVFATLNQRSNSEAETLLRKLSAEEQTRLLGAMQAIEAILDDAAEDLPPTIIRRHRAGDIGWITYRHGQNYAAEYGFDESFEALVAKILADLVLEGDPQREAIWIAERDGERVASIVCADAGKGVAQLRLLLVEPQARGSGLGGALIDECLRFARQVGYRSIKLWTQSILNTARHLYEKAGFRLVEKEEHRSFGKNLVAEIWAMDLND